MTERRAGLSSYALKRIAMALMLADHIGILLHGMLPKAAYFALRAAGRSAFPLFCFLLVEGFRYTKNRWKYLRNLAVFAVISELPADLFVRGWENRAAGMNVFVTLLLGLLVLMALEGLLARAAEKRWGSALVCAAGAAAPAAAAWLLSPSYSVYGVALIALLYLAERGAALVRKLDAQRARDLAAAAAVAAWNAGYALRSAGRLQLYGMLACLPILLYGGRRGGSRLPKWCFYAFYPAHLLALYLIRTAFFAG